MNTTEIHRIKKTNNFTVLSNSLISDKRLKYSDIGIMAYLLSKPDNWVINSSEVIGSHEDGRAAVRSSFSRLMEFGYIERTKTRTDTGSYVWEYKLYETSKYGDSDEISQRSLPAGGKPSVVTNPLLNTDNKELINKTTNISTKNDLVESWLKIPTKGYKRSHVIKAYILTMANDINGYDSNYVSVDILKKITKLAYNLHNITNIEREISDIVAMLVHDRDDDTWSDDIQVNTNISDTLDSCSTTQDITTKDIDSNIVTKLAHLYTGTNDIQKFISMYGNSPSLITSINNAVLDKTITQFIDMCITDNTAYTYGINDRI